MINAALVLLGIGPNNSTPTYYQLYLSQYIASYIGYGLRNKLYDHIQHLSFSYHDHAQTGQLISRTLEGVRSVENFARHRPPPFKRAKCRPHGGRPGRPNRRAGHTHRRLARTGVYVQLYLAGFEE